MVASRLAEGGGADGLGDDGWTVRIANPRTVIGTVEDDHRTLAWIVSQRWQDSRCEATFRSGCATDGSPNYLG